MIFKNLTDHYLSLINGDISRQEYENCHPALFDHYLTFWASPESSYHRIKPDELKRNLGFIKAALLRIETKLAGKGIDLSHLEITAFVGKNTSNGHAIKNGAGFAVWLPVETYTSQKLADIFIAHEIIHALHYAARPEFYFSTTTEQNKMFRQLITEGIATHLTAEWLDVPDAEALWGDFLSADMAAKWLKECRKQRRQLWKFCMAKIENDADARSFFVLSDPNDIYSWRAGYYIGMETIRQIQRIFQLTPSDLTNLTGQEIHSALDLVSFE